MESSFVKINQNDGYQTRLFCYESSLDTVLGSILVLHGMAEHHGRYLNFIRALTAEGFDVYTYDHRGHGTDKKLSELGFVAKKKGASVLIEDAHTIYRYLKENARTEKLAIFGHSMGSLILRCLLTKCDTLDCAIVSSTTMPPVAVSRVGSALAGLFCTFRGPKKPSAFLQKAMFGGKVYTSLCTRTTYDWLTRNNTIVGKYIDDPYCGFTCTTSFYRDLAVLAAKAANKHNIAKTKKDLPILFLAGGKDPVSNYATQVTRLRKLYLSCGCNYAELILYPEDRHEILNELNADEVYADIITYLHSHLN